jgi:hypothetical protein
MNKKSLWSCVIASCIFTAQLLAQDTNYWTQQYGTRSTLLGGAVIGSVTDLGSTFYNPGRLAFKTELGFLISAKIYQLETITVKDGVGKGIDLPYSSFGTAPSLVAGSFNLGFLKDHHFAYSFLTRQRSETRFVLRQGGIKNIIATAPGDEIYAGEITTSQDLKDEWLGLTWAHALGAKASLGVTNYLSIRNHSSSFRTIVEALKQDNQTAALLRLNEFDYKTYGLLWKLGFALDLSPVSAGLTITTPRLHVTGSGSTLFNDLLAGVDRDGDGLNDDLAEGNLQSDLEATYKTPWAIGAGAGVRFKKGQLHLTAEWYDQVNKFVVLDPVDYLGQSTGDTLRRKIVQELADVLNFGVGVELYLSEKFSGYGSFATDFSALGSEVSALRESAEETNAVSSSWDLYHMAGGAVFEIARAELALGVAYAFGSQDVSRANDIPQDGVASDNEEIAKINFSRWRFVFGFAISF